MIGERGVDWSCCCGVVVVEESDVRRLGFEIFVMAVRLNLQGSALMVHVLYNVGEQHGTDFFWK